MRGGTIETWNTAQQVRSFFGPIDTREEAIILALAEGYSWGSEKERAAVRESGAGWELIVIRMIQFCDPVQTDRYLLRVLPDGTLTELKSEIWRRTEGVCILRSPRVRRGLTFSEIGASVGERARAPND